MQECYGCVIRQKTNLDPTGRVEYIGRNKNFRPMKMNMSTHIMDQGDWSNFDWLKNIAPCMVRYDGTMDYRLDPNDYTKKEDGTPSDIADLSYPGNAMVWIPKIYKYEYCVAGDRYILFSERKLSDDFIPEGFWDSEEKELEGQWIPMFYGTEDTEGRIRSMATGFPTKNKTADQQKAAIEKNGPRWKFYGGPIHETIHAMLILLSKSTDSQAAFGYGNCSGYNSDDTVNYGMLQNAVIGGGMFYGSSDQKSLNKIFHSVMLGTYQQYQRDPYVLLLNGVLKVSPYYKYDATGATYKDTGIRYSETAKDAWRYPHIRQYTKGFGSFPVEPFKGGVSLGYCEGFCFTIASVRMSLRFLNSWGGSIAGAGAVDLRYSPTYTEWNTGASPVLNPPEGYALV